MTNTNDTTAISVTHNQRITTMSTDSTDTMHDQPCQIADLHSPPGEDTEAVPFYERLLEREAEQYGDDSLELTNTLTALGNALMHAGHYEEALTVFERLLEIQETALGENHPDVLGTLPRVIDACESCGMYFLGAMYYDRLHPDEQLESNDDQSQAGVPHTSADLPQAVRKALGADLASVIDKLDPHYGYLFAIVVLALKDGMPVYIEQDSSATTHALSRELKLVVDTKKFT